MKDVWFQLILWGYSVVYADNIPFRHDEALCASERELDQFASWDKKEPYLYTLIVNDEIPPLYWCCTYLVRYHYEVEV